MTTDVPEGVTPFDKLNLGSDEPLDRDFDVITEPDNREDVTGDVEDDLSVTDLVNYGKQVVQAAGAGLEIIESIVKATGNQTAIQAVTALRNSNKVADSSLQLLGTLEKKGLFDPYSDISVDVPTGNGSSEDDAVMAQLKRLIKQ